MNDNTFQTAPQLLCLQKSEQGLSLSHFGNSFVYETPNPDLSLRILQSLKKPKSFQILLKEIKSTKANIPTIRNEMRRLEESHLICTRAMKLKNDHFEDSEKFDFISSDSFDLANIGSALSKFKVGILAIGPISDRLPSAFASFGFKKITKLTPPTNTSDDRDFLEVAKGQDLMVIVADESRSLEISRLNQLLHKNRKPWLLCRVDAFGGVFGPLFGIAGGPCFDCMIDHFNQGYWVPDDSTRQNDLLSDSQAQKHETVLSHSIYPMIASEVLKISTRITRPQTMDGFYRIDMFNFRMEYKNASPSPTCPTCSGFAGRRD